LPRQRKRSLQKPGTGCPDNYTGGFDQGEGTGRRHHHLLGILGRLNEVFYVICLDSQNKVNHATLLHEGTINEAPVYPRLIVETALRYQAASIILAHNYPGGSLQPSQADVDVTRKIKQATEAISIIVADHIIVAGESYYSFAENRLL